MTPRLKNALFLLITGCFATCISLQSSAQINNTSLSDNIIIDPAKADTFGISVNASGYLRNTEYFNDIESGRTLFGYQVNPSFYIQPGPFFKIQAGVFIQSHFGDRPVYSRVIPTFSIKYKKNRNAFVFGTLEGALAHRLIEPMFDISSGIERRIENGFQFRHESPRSFLDVWINWERFIERGSPFKEQFTAGVNYAPVFLRMNSFTFSLPVQGTAFHRGGQIDSDTSNMLMVFNAAAGLSIKNDVTGPVNNVRFVEASVYRLFYRENSNSGYMPFRNGSGLYANLNVYIKQLNVILSYWNGNEFIAPRGTSIYQSVSIDKPGFFSRNRELMFLRFMYERTLYKNLSLNLRFEPFYDFSSRQTEYSYSLYLTYRENFALGRLK